MGQALYRKYRSRSLDEIVGQEHITTTLKNALKNGRISHAYLFTGPRGVGKTSIARILAYEINGLPYTYDTQQHLDIIEIDAASNRRIDEIRELRDKVHVAPSSAKYKVYIIDEVHMLTKEAFNALLKTLEEPPQHVVFILATTEAHKLPETIVSRTQRFAFKPIDNQKAVEHLHSLAKAEKIKIDDESLQLIAEHSGGSFRDSISLLDQISGLNDTIASEQVRQMIGIPATTAIEALMSTVRTGQTSELTEQLNALYNQGYQAPQIAKQISQGINAQEHLDGGDLAMLRQLLEVPASHDPKSYLELVLLEFSLILQPQQADNSQTSSRLAHEENSTPQQAHKASQEAPESTKAETKPKANNKDNLWSRALEELKGRHNTLYGIARMAYASQAGNTVTLTFAFPFHQRRCNEARNRERIEAILHELSDGKTIKLECVVGKASDKKPVAHPKHKPKQNKKSDTLDSVTEVFGGGEILE